MRQWYVSYRSLMGQSFWYLTVLVKSLHLIWTSNSSIISSYPKFKVEFQCLTYRGQVTQIWNPVNMFDLNLNQKIFTVENEFDTCRLQDNGYFVSVLTHLSLDKMAAISETIYSDAFSSMESCVFRLRFYISSTFVARGPINNNPTLV